MFRAPTTLTRLRFALIFVAACSGPGCGARQNPTDPAASTASVAPAAPTVAASGRSQASTPKAGFVGHDSQVSRGELTFTSDAEANRYDKLQACLQRSSSEWYAYPLRRIGNSINIEWCRGAGAENNCGGDRTRSSQGAGWASLGVYQYDRDKPSVFGLSFSAADMPATDGIGVSLSWTQDAARISADHLIISARQVVGGEVKGKLYLSMEAGFSAGLEEISVKARGSQTDLYRRLRESPASLRDEAIARMDRLEVAVKSSIAADTPRKCIYGKYRNDGIEPRCIKKVPLDSADKEAARERLEKYLAPQRALVTNHAEEIHRRLVELLPDDCFAP